MFSHFLPCFNLPDCGNSFSVTNGLVNFTNADTTYGHSVEVTCNTGYERTGGTSIECLDDELWSTSTTCEIKGMHLCSCFVVQKSKYLYPSCLQYLRALFFILSSATLQTH